LVLLKSSGNFSHFIKKGQILDTKWDKSGTLVFTTIWLREPKCSLLKTDIKKVPDNISHLVAISPQLGLNLTVIFSFAVL